MHTEKENDNSYYRYAKYMVDYSQAYKANGWSREMIRRNRINIAGRFDREMYDMNNMVLSTENYKESLENSDKQIWEVPFFYEPYDEDNDSTDEEQVEKALESTMEEEEDDDDKEVQEPSEFKGRLDHGLIPFIA